MIDLNLKGEIGARDGIIVNVTCQLGGMWIGSQTLSVWPQPTSAAGEWACDSVKTCL